MGEDVVNVVIPIVVNVVNVLNVVDQLYKNPLRHIQFQAHAPLFVSRIIKTLSIVLSMLK